MTARPGWLAAEIARTLASPTYRAMVAEARQRAETEAVLAEFHDHAYSLASEVVRLRRASA